MRRREFLAGAVGAAMLDAVGRTEALLPIPDAAPEPAQPHLEPMAVGLLIRPAKDPEASIRTVHELGMTNCFLSLDGYLGRYSNDLAQQLRGLLEKYSVVATAAEVVGPGPLVWNFLRGPSTIGLVPRATRPARMDALKQTSDFAALLGIRQVQTHCGFLPEDPADPIYAEAVTAIREVAQHCAGNGQMFLMETGQETPTTMSRALQDVNEKNLGVGLDTANLILYGKANPSDAVDILGPHVRSIHAKDGRWPKDPMKLGEEVLIGTGLVDFRTVFTKLHRLGYAGMVTIEREISGPQQIADVKQEKAYLERVLAAVLREQA